ncbi:MAG TPA: DUF3179 domain-containing (seleno)protein [Candidatus Krumholzibacteria bacterium]|jgi:hypothetical protein
MRTRSCRPAPIALLALALLAGCAGEEQIFKTSPPTRGLALVDAGLSPSEPLALERPFAWAVARDADSVLVHVAYLSEERLSEEGGAPRREDFEALRLEPVSPVDQRFERAYELRLDPRPADRVMFYYFEAHAGAAESVSQPVGGADDPVPVGARPIDIDFDWPGWPIPFEPLVCNFDRSLFDADYAAPGLDFQELNDPIFVGESRATIFGNIEGLEEGIGAEIDGQPYFFPLAIMLWQEVLNHHFDGKPTVLSYCPLTDSALLFSHDNAGLKTGRWEAGGLYNNNLVVVEPKNPRNKVPQMLAFALEGDRDGSCVDIQPSFLCSWKIWGRLYPNSLILNADRVVDEVDWLSRDNIYRAYWRNDLEIRFPISRRDDEHPLGLQNKDRVVGIIGEGQPMAIAMSIDGQQQGFVLNEDRGTRPMVVFAFPSAGFAGVFDRRLPSTGELLHFKKATASYNSYRLYEDDMPESSLWMPTGVAVAGPLAGTRLSWIPSMRAFWFAWYAMYPESLIIDPYESGEL